MTKSVLDALLAYIDARIEEKTSSHIQDTVRVLELRDKLMQAAAAAAEREVDA